MIYYFRFLKGFRFLLQMARSTGKAREKGFRKIHLSERNHGFAKGCHMVLAKVHVTRTKSQSRRFSTQLKWCVKFTCWWFHRRGGQVKKWKTISNVFWTVIFKIETGTSGHANGIYHVAFQISRLIRMNQFISGTHWHIQNMFSSNSNGELLVLGIARQEVKVACAVIHVRC